MRGSLSATTRADICHADPHEQGRTPMSVTYEHTALKKEGRGSRPTVGYVRDTYIDSRPNPKNKNRSLGHAGRFARKLLGDSQNDDDHEILTISSMAFIVLVLVIFAFVP